MLLGLLNKSIIADFTIACANILLQQGIARLATDTRSTATEWKRATAGIV